MAESVTAAPASPSLIRILGATRWLAGLGACIVPLLWVVDPWGFVRHNVVLDQFVAVELAFALCCSLLSSAIATKAAAMRWLYIVASIAGLTLGVWLFHFYSPDSFVVIRPTPILLTVSVVALAVSLFAGWKASGPETVLLILGVLVFGYIAQFLPSWIGSPPNKLTTYVFYMVFGSNGVLGQALQIISTSVVVFLLFGAAFELAGGTRAIGAVALLVARYGRGAAISVGIIASALFGMISGSATSNVLAAGSFSIPGMKKMGLEPKTAAGIEAVASTIGQVMPPVMGAAAFLMANVTGIPYSQIALASLTPAALCYLALFLQGEAIGRRLERTQGAVTVDTEHTSLGWGDLLHLLPVAGLIISLLTAQSRPELAGAVAAGLALVVAVIRKGPRATWRGFLEMLPKTGKSVSGLVVTASTVGILLAVIAATGLDVQLTLLISKVGAYNLFLSLLLASFAAFILGLGVGTSGVYIVAGTLLAPGLVHLGVPMIAAHLFVLYSAMLSMITPPVAFASLTAAGVAGAGFYETSNEAMKFGWAVFLVPFLIPYSPELVLVGDGWAIAGVIFSTFVGVTLIGRYALGDVGWIWRWRSSQWGALIYGSLIVLPILPLPARLAGATAAMFLISGTWIRLRFVAKPGV